MEAPSTAGREPRGPDTAVAPAAGAGPVPGPGRDSAPGPLSAVLPRAEAVAAARAAVRQARARHLGTAHSTREAAPSVPEPAPEASGNRWPRTCAGPETGLVPRTERGGAPETGPGSGPRAEHGPEPGASWRTRLSEAVRERLPLWAQTRCGVEPRALAALALLLALALGFAAHHFWTGRPQPVQAPPVETAARSHPAPPPASPSVPPPGLPAAPPSGGGPLVVDVAGKVRRPGVHRLPSG
ncbi:MAG TPA: hypothetical protein VFY14_04635, partial [Streptomyces sp.]|nr:hypothetical protein [Streptomyces sp.]